MATIETTIAAEIGCSPADRAAKIARILKAEYHPDDSEANITDILADLRHYCDAQELDFAAHDRRAYRHYLAEIA